MPFLSPGDLPDLGIEPISPALAGSSLPLSHQGSPKYNDTLPKELNIYLNYWVNRATWICQMSDVRFVIKCARFATSQVRFKSFLAYAGLVAKSCQASLSFTISLSLLKLMFIESVMPSNHLILSPPPPPALNLSQHQVLFQLVSSSPQVAKVLELQLQHQSFQ